MKNNSSLIHLACMSTFQAWLQGVARLGLIWVAGAAMSACAGVPGPSGTSWREEVLLHDGGKIIVTRSQIYGGRHEIGQPPPVQEHTINFTLPNTNTNITWASEYGEDVGRANFNLVALHILSNTPYVVASPNLCLSYNKWGRPNPPYVLFKFDGGAWQRIALAELPPEFKEVNVVVNVTREQYIKEREKRAGYVQAADVRDINSSLTQPEYQSILREAVPGVGKECEEMVHVGKGKWIGVGWFRKQPSYEACVKYCEFERVDAPNCPCATYFGGTKEQKGSETNCFLTPSPCCEPAR